MSVIIMFGNNVKICASKIQIFLITATIFADKCKKNLCKRFLAKFLQLIMQNDAVFYVF